MFAPKSSLLGTALWSTAFFLAAALVVWVLLY
jgi:hypothetical protein